LRRRWPLHALPTRLLRGRGHLGTSAARARAEEEAAAAWDAGDWAVAQDRWRAVLDTWSRKAPPRVYARLSGAERRAGNHERAERTLLEGLERHPGNERLSRAFADLASQRRDWVAAAERWRRVVAVEDVPRASSSVRLAGALRRLARFDEAEAVLDRSVARMPNEVPLLREHALVATARGDDAVAVERWRRLAERSALPPGDLVRYSRALRRVGEPARAATSLREGLKERPGDADLLHEAAETAMSRWDWETAAAYWQRLLALADGVVPAAWHHRLGYCLELRGRSAEAAEAYDTALAGLAAVDRPWANEAAVAWRFRRDYARRHAAPPAVDADPRLGMTVRPAGAPAHPADAGRFGAVVTHKGVRIDGNVTGAGSTVAVRVDGRLLRTLAVDESVVPAAFALHLKHPTLATFPEVSELAITRDGVPLATAAGTTSTTLTVPHGRGTLWELVDGGATVTKKGTLFDPAVFARDGARRQLELYAGVRRVVADALGQPLLLLYGTLLGFHRDGAFIPGDDDLDAGYLIDATDPDGVKLQATATAERLLHAGYDVTTRFGGGLLKVFSGDVEVDLYPIWRHAGRLWAYDAIAAGPDALLPARTGTLHGFEVDVPCDPEALLVSSYGSGWRVPDPSFQHVRSPEELAVIESVYLTPGEGRRLAARNARDRVTDPNTGTFCVTRDPYADPASLRAP
jgi:tetratricopeptide (TPR) repeat protein